MPATAPEFHQAYGRWLGDVRPAWPLLPREVLIALAGARLGENGAVRVAADLGLGELAGAPALVNARRVLEALIAEGGARLTAAGNLNLKFVAAMVERFDWPDHAPADVHRFTKRVGEQEFLPLHYLRVVLGLAGLVRRYRGQLRATKEAQRLLAAERAGELMRTLLVTTCERYNLAYLDAVPVKAYPQDHIALVLFLLGQVARDWQPPERLARLASLPTAIPPEEGYDPLRLAFELRALRHLTWFGLMEQRAGEASGGPLPAPRLYRVAPLFDRVLRFELPGIAASEARH